MKTMTIVSLLILAVGVYLEYQKDSSFASVDTGSILIGTGAGLMLGNML
jgi:hypothetical protein